MWKGQSSHLVSSTKTKQIWTNRKGGMGLKTTYELGKERNRYVTIIECDASI